ncbi:MAG: hypothetical protein JSW34_09210 [Candidatus Zixiibacteriota bacterium]|nr:MAG: hypothetical protein JSW34_09210 [candidate division Zixibacteria bacterium]
MRASLLCIGILAVLLMSCENKDYTSDSGDDLPTVVYSIEDEPSLSDDREYAYFVALDTLFPGNTGLYRARVTDPVREGLLGGSGLHSPVPSFDGTRVAFLSGSSINYLNLADGSVVSSGVSGNYTSIIFVDDSTLIGCVGQLLYEINVDDSSVAFIGNGYDPTFYQPDVFIYLTELSTDTFGIMRYAPGSDIPQAAQADIDTLDTIISGDRVRWVSVDPSSQHYVYLIEGADSNYVYTSTIGSEDSSLVARTRGSKVILVNHDMVLYRGGDGRLYQSDFRGNQKLPFWSMQ